MTVELATIIVSLVIVFAQGIGALINNGRYSKLELKMERRLTRLETRLFGKPLPSDEGED